MGMVDLVVVSITTTIVDTDHVRLRVHSFFVTRLTTRSAVAACEGTLL